MMTPVPHVIIYIQDDGIPAIVYPFPDALEAYGIEAIAIKDVPAGKPFAIIDATLLPNDYPQEVWVVDPADLTDGVGADGYEFPLQATE
jgi:hypothetical protein